MHRAGCTGAASLTDEQDPGIRQDRPMQCETEGNDTNGIADIQ